MMKQRAKINPQIFIQISVLLQVVGKGEMRQGRTGEEGHRHMVEERERELRIG